MLGTREVDGGGGGGGGVEKERGRGGKEGRLVSWCFELSQPMRGVGGGGCRQTDRDS